MTEYHYTSDNKSYNVQADSPAQAVFQFMIQHDLVVNDDDMICVEPFEMNDF